eukprot:4346594-Alexandrium_andersonii.AAC.1
MSASLVGSEMCIRDRGSLSLGRGASPVVPVLEDKHDGLEGLGSTEVLACLLYTSDAADDM